MTQRDHESLAEHDPHELLFGFDDDGHGENEDGDEHGGNHYRDRHYGQDRTATDRDDSARAGRRGGRDRDDAAPGARPLPAGSRGGRQAERRRAARTRRVFVVLALAVVVVAAAAAWVVVPRLSSLFGPSDYDGAGNGRVTITVNQGDSTTDIANTLAQADVIKSAAAFTDAASGNSRVKEIQPGTYVLRSHMSGGAALDLLLDPASRNAAGDVVVIEGATGFDVAARLGGVLGGKDKAVLAAIDDPAELGLPLGYTVNGKAPASAEGFLYPATYNIDPKASPESALQKMITKFTDQDRSMGFATKAKALGVTPYQALIIASVAQSEAKFPEDMTKVVRVIFNRLAAGQALQIDATTRYGAMVNGVNPSSVAYHNYNTPYNSYLHTGLPPTPISNPGEDALSAAVNPAAGNWMYYVNGDAEGHLFFTNDERAFLDAVTKCRDNNWGCG